MRRIAFAVIVALSALLLCSTSTFAQTGVYISGTTFADIRQFGSTSQSPLVSDFSRDAIGAGGGVRVGTWVHPRWTLEVGAEVATRTTTTFSGPVIAIFPPPRGLDFRASSSFINVTTMVGFHAPAGRRVRMGYRAGFSFVRATHTTEIPFDALPFFTFEDLLGSITTVPRTSLALPSGSLASKQNSGALTLGIEAAIVLTPKIALVPELRASTWSGVFLIRPGAGVRWSF
jgi:hypothetical protein